MSLSPDNFLVRTARRVILAAALLALVRIADVRAAESNSAKVTQIIKDVRLLGTQAAPRPASVSDEVSGGTAVRTGVESRAELTFTDLTITRLGENTVFSFAQNARNLTLGSGAILVQVPPKSPAAQVTTAAFTCAVSGGTALLSSNQNAPHKILILEGKGKVCSIKYPDECVTLNRGEMMVLTPDGHLTKKEKFNAKLVYQTSHLLNDFPPLPNDPLIQETIDEQETEQENENNQAGATPTPGETTDTVDQRNASMTPTPPPSGSPGGSPGKFGPPPTITSPNPYVIGSGTQIQTDPTITTNGLTSNGTIYRDSAQDGSAPDFLFGSTRPFDANVFDGGNEDGPYAVFKFQSLQLAGDPSISTANGGATNLALVGVDGVTSGGSGATLTFAGLNRVFIGTQNGPINLGSEISFTGADRLTFYARGTGANLTLGSAISVDRLKLYGENNIQVNGTEEVSSFKAIAGNDFTFGENGSLTGSEIEISAGHDITIDANRIPGPGVDGFGESVSLDAGNTLSVTIHRTDNPEEHDTFEWNTLALAGKTINLIGEPSATPPPGPNEPAPVTPVEFDFSGSDSVTAHAGTGGFNAPAIIFYGHNLSIFSEGGITIYSAITPFADDQHILDGTMQADGNIVSTGDVFTGYISAGQAISVGGHLTALDIHAGGGIFANTGLTAEGGSIIAEDGNITVNGVLELKEDEQHDFGRIEAEFDISASGGIFTPGDPASVVAGRTITAPAIITGDLQAGSDITIDNTAGNFSFGIIANNITTDGTLFMINSPTISPNNGGSSGSDGETFDDFTLTAASISSTGPVIPVLSSNGGDANKDDASSSPGNGGNITVHITGAGLSIGDAQDLARIEANGGEFNGEAEAGGHGGSITITAAGDVNVAAVDGAPTISATTGVVPNIFTDFGGEGGTVSIATSGGITVGGTIIVSSDDVASLFSRASAPTPREGSTPGRESVSGGTILLQSDATTGEGITVSEGGALLSLLNSGAAGPGSSITLSTMGADITVNGLIEADRGTITIDQDDPLILTPLITLDGATLVSKTLNVHSIGDLNIAANSSTSLYFSDATLHADNDVNWNVGQTTLNESINSIAVNGGNAVNLNGGDSETFVSLNLNLSHDSSITAGTGGINAPYVDIAFAGAALDVISGGDITIGELEFSDFIARGKVMADGAISVTDNLGTGIVDAGTSIDVGGDLFATSVTAGTTISVGNTLHSSSVTAGGDISASTTHVQNINAPDGVLTVSNSIAPDVFSTVDTIAEQGAKAPHEYTIDSIDGGALIDFSGNQFGGIHDYSSGGILTLNVNTFFIGSTSRTNGFIVTGVSGVNFNGADQGTVGFDSEVFADAGGDGGTFTVNAKNDIDIYGTIEATTGLQDPGDAAHGTGGTVNLKSENGTVTVNDLIKVSSDDPVSDGPAEPLPPSPVRRSAAGGNINIQSGRATGTAISVTNSAQLLALLDNAAPGPGGTITIKATGASSTASVDGTVWANRGLVDVRQTGDDGIITLGPSMDIRADTVKIGALGLNGALNISGGAISADTLLKLYAGGSNGTINFNASVTLTTPQAIIAANTININGTNTVVTIASANPAQIYTNNPNYRGNGGTGDANTGTFSGPVTAPQAFSSRPDFDPGGNALRRNRGNH